MRACFVHVVLCSGATRTYPSSALNSDIMYSAYGSISPESLAKRGQIENPRYQNRYPQNRISLNEISLQALTNLFLMGRGNNSRHIYDYAGPRCASLSRYDRCPVFSGVKNPVPPNYSFAKQSGCACGKYKKSNPQGVLASEAGYCDGCFSFSLRSLRGGRHPVCNLSG